VAAVEQAGARVRHHSRWLNAVSVAAGPEALDRVRALPFVLRVEPVRGAQRSPADALSPVPTRPPLGSPAEEGLDHGLAEQQLAMIGLTKLHQAGYTGAGVVIGVLDTGFVTTHASFTDPGHPLRVRAAWDFVDDDPDPSFQLGDHPNQHEHGTIILGTMAAYAPGTYVGGAFDAEFVLAKTENVACEIPAEEDDYVAGLEFAEQQGADVVTSSLSYSAWYTQEDMDGRTAVTSIAVSFAAANGVHCVTGAGNKGHDADPATSHLGAPADGFRVLSVGAVGITGETPGFSSDGPTADGRVKPEVMAVGSQAWSVHPNVDDGYSTFNGTSMSTPQITATVACLVQAHPDWTVDEVRTHLMASGSVYRATGTFDPLYVEGYGLVDGLIAEGGDCDASGVRDRVEIDARLLPDCDGNRVPDSCDLRFGTWPDADLDGVPDVCKKARRVPRGSLGGPSKVLFGRR
jgi:serine protease AprX